LIDIPGTIDVTPSTKDDGTEVVVTVDRAKASELGLSSIFVAQTLRNAVQGSTATTIQHNGEDIDVVVKLDLNPDFLDAHDTTRTTIDSLRYIEVMSPKGPVLLGSIFDTAIAKGNAVIRHEDRERIASVTSELRDGVLASDVIKKFEERKDELALPSGIIMKIGGETEDVDQSFRDMFVALIVGIILIAAILVLQFNSFRQAFFIVLIVPFSLIGIFAGLFITGNFLSFPSLMGYIALSGIVVNNSIILIDKMNKIRRTNREMPIEEVVYAGSVSRLRPILLTTLTTVIGIFPLTYASDLWGPLAWSIIFGLSFSVIITLILIPILYSRWPGKIN